MTDQSLLDAGCRVALAGLLHDLGKFAERARLDVPVERLEGDVHQYCPFHREGQWFSHKHAAYTAAGMDHLEHLLPPIRGDDLAPFASWGDREVDDSMINAAARHHRPETMLQWIIATADRVSSGFDRESFAHYNRQPEEGASGGARPDHYRARQLTLFEQVRLSEGKPAELLYRYPLQPLSPESSFPQPGAECEPRTRSQAQSEYAKLWEAFEIALSRIPEAHQRHWHLWLDHFDTAWATFTHCIPAATAFGVRPDISLYDHSKAVAALAVALWRYHHEGGDDPAAVRDAMAAYSDWGDSKLLLVQGDLFGIQEFIFGTGGESQRRAAKLLRGRSFYASLLTECAALRVLDALDLPPTSQIINAAGKFLIVAPNTDRTAEALRAVSQDIDDWFLKQSFGQSGIGLAWIPASCDDFKAGSGVESPFAALMQRLFARLEAAKLRRFDLCGDDAPPPVFEGALERYAEGPCRLDGRLPAEVQMDGELWVSRLARDQITAGTQLTRSSRLLVGRDVNPGRALDVRIFGYTVSFADGDAGVAPDGLRRAWDFSLPDSGEAALWTGWARRYINAYVPRFSEATASELQHRSRSTESGEFPEPGDPMTFEHLAEAARRTVRAEDGDTRWVGVAALAMLKGDVDDLGAIFQRGLDAPSFGRMAALSRQLNAFFAVYLPWLCERAFPNTYTVFAGGDDFFLIGPWREQVRLASRLRSDFQRYTADNPEIHFSAGLYMAKPGLPVRHLAGAAEEALESSKAFGGGSKNAVTCFGETVPWNDFAALGQATARLAELAGDLDLSTRYVYGLLELVEMNALLAEGRAGLAWSRCALWHSKFQYRTYRMLERNRRLDGPKRRRALEQLAQAIVEQGIRRFGRTYRIALTHHLYSISLHTTHGPDAS